MPIPKPIKLTAYTLFTTNMHSFAGTYEMSNKNPTRLRRVLHATVCHDTFSLCHKPFHVLRIVRCEFVQEQTRYKRERNDVPLMNTSRLEACENTCKLAWRIKRKHLVQLACKGTLAAYVQEKKTELQAENKDSQEAVIETRWKKSSHYAMRSLPPHFFQAFSRPTKEIDMRLKACLSIA